MQLPNPQSACGTDVGTRIAGSAANQFNAVALDSHGDAVLDHWNHRVHLCPAASPGTTCLTAACTTSMTGSNSTELNGPRGVSFTVNGDCLIAEYLGHRVQLCPVEGLRGRALLGVETTS